MNYQEYDFLYKILLIGNSSVGKSCILLRFVDDVFNQTFIPTIGVDFKMKTIEIESKVIKLQIWDTAGQEKFKTITANYYNGAHGIIIVYDISDKQSFIDLDNWLFEVEKHASDNCIKFLIGNKVDLESERQVTYDEGAAYSKVHNMNFYETSAKDNTNIETLFESLAKNIKESAQINKEIESQIGKGKYLDKSGTKIDTSNKEDNLEKKKFLCC